MVSDRHASSCENTWEHVFSIDIKSAPEQADLLVAELWAAGSEGIVELPGGSLRAFFENDAQAEEIGKRFQAADWRHEEDQDWVALSQANWEPMEIGARFFLAPEWRSDPTPAGRFRIEVNNGLAFGTGRHETTQLCLEAMETHLRPGGGVLDIGTGAGILAQAAHLLGADIVWACDIDPEAVAVAREKLGPNLFTGSVDAFRSGAAGF